MARPPRTCYTGAHGYYRRNQFLIWRQTPDGYKCLTVAQCLECPPIQVAAVQAGSSRPARFRRARVRRKAATLVPA